MTEKKSIALRIDPKLWRELQRWADADLRSINGQIEYLLREAVARRTRQEITPTPPQSPAPSPKRAAEK